MDEQTLFLGTGPQVDRPIFRGVFNGVAQDVQDRHLQQAFIHVERRKTIGKIHLQVDVFLCTLGLDHFQNAFQQLFKPRGGDVETGQTALQPRNVQQIVDHLGQPERFFIDDVIKIVSCVLVHRLLIDQHLHVRQNGRQGCAEFMGDVIDEINNRSTNIVARINDSGDGIILEDTQSTGGVQMVVADQGGYSARDLQLHGIAVEGQNYIDGSYEFKLDIGGGDSIEDIVAAINEADFGVKASIMTAGSGYRISLNSMISGSVGTMYLDAGQIDGFNTQTLSAGQDAIVFYGDGGASNGLLIRSHSNTIENVAKGLTLELNSTSDSPVDVEVNEDLDAIIAQIQSFADAYNEAMDEIDQMTRFDPETLERGLLFSDHTVEMARRSLQSLATRMVPGVSSELSRLSQVGIKFSRLGSESGTNAAGDTVNYAVARTPRLQFDESKFRAAFGADPEGVTELFTKADVGIGDYMSDALDRLAGTSESTFNSRVNAIQSRQKLFERRIESLDELLKAKENRLYKQFYAMEEALASLQSQQDALSSLAQLASSVKS